MSENPETSDAILLRLRALALQKLAIRSRVITGALAERDLERCRGDIAIAIAAMDEKRADLADIAGRARSAAISLESALYMSGTSSEDGMSAGEILGAVRAWLDDAGDV